METGQTSDNCLNCGAGVSGNFCHQCGQKTTTGRLSWRSVWYQFVSLLEIDRGFFLSSIKLLRSPGPMIGEYIDGKRQRYSNPLKMFVLIGTVSVWVTFRYELFALQVEEELLWFLALPDWEGYYKYSSRYFVVFTFMALPLFSLFSWWVFRAMRWRFIEHLVLNIYIAVGQLILFILLSPALYFAGEWMDMIYFVINFGYNVLVLYQIFGKSSAGGVMRPLLAVLIPQLIGYYFNYVIYRIFPADFWTMLDTLLS